MGIRARWMMIVVGLVAATASCADVPDATAPIEPAFAKGGRGGGGGPAPGDMVALGEAIFFDRNLSVNTNQACSTCHDPSEGFAAPVVGVPTVGSVVKGSVQSRNGDRKPPTSAYATLSPLFSASGKGATGGNFWDGRATGELLGNPAADQALGPFLNPAEQAMPDKACIIWRIVGSSYLSAWEDVWGGAIAQINFPASVGTTCTTPVLQPGEYVSLSGPDRVTIDQAYDQVALSIAAFESSTNNFSSRFDAGQLTTQEIEGEKLFSSKGKCHQCHDNNAKDTGALYTDFQFHNLGVPRNPQHPVYPYGTAAFDPGLGGFTGEAVDMGKFKTPTVRNVGLGTNRTYMHNGSLVDLRQVVQFYNTRDVLRACTGPELNNPAVWGPDGIGCWPPPEYPENMDTKQMGNLGLTAAEVDAIVAFMRALTDL